MPAEGRPTTPLVLVVTRTAIALALLLVLLYAVGRELATPPDVPSTATMPAERRWWRLSSVLAVSAVVLTAFVLGSYLMIRAGRAFLARPGRPGRTAFRDAWSNYRLTDEEIEAATREPPSDEAGPDGDGLDTDGRPPRQF